MRTTVRHLALLPACLVVVLGAVACGDDAEPVASGPGTDPAAAPSTTAPPRYTATATVLESTDHGPQLCFGVEDSYPPQCGGPDVVGWDWDDVEGAESAGGTTWGTYTLVGTWDGAALTLTEPPRAPEPPTDPGAADRFRSPCPVPEGGWQVVDPATATDEALDRAVEHARSQPDVGGVWLDQSMNPATSEEGMNDPTRLVLNVTFTGDLERHEAELRERWGGALCVSGAERSAAELARVRAEAEAAAGDLVWSSTDEVTGTVELGVVVDDGLQARFDERYGAGVVVVRPQLRPVEG